MDRDGFKIQTLARCVCLVVSPFFDKFLVFCGFPFKPRILPRGSPFLASPIPGVRTMCWQRTRLTRRPCHPFCWTRCLSALSGNTRCIGMSTGILWPGVWPCFLSYREMDRHSVSGLLCSSSSWSERLTRDTDASASGHSTVLVLPRMLCADACGNYRRR